ncbi:MAG: chromosomal replication initiator protein DnaA [Eubacteriales bacterium]
MEFNNDTDLSEIRQMLYEHMKQNYPHTQKSFELWFSYLKLRYLDTEKAIFVCDTSIKYKVLMNNHLEFIKSCLEDVIGYTPEVIIEIDPSVAPPNPYNHNMFMKKPGETPEETSSSSENTADSAAKPDDDYYDEYSDGADDEEPDEVTFTPYTPMKHTTDSGNRNWSHPEAPNLSAYEEKKNTGSIPSSPAVITNEEREGETYGKNRDEKWISYIKDYTFENFIVGSSNQLAHASAMNVADHIGTMVNPLFIWGPSGLGKTHLMYAIANRALIHNPNMKIICIKGEEFTNQLVDAIQKNRNRQFRQKFRSCDMLMIDDIQFIAGKESTQTEFFHTFDALYEDKKQIILTSDRPPRELESLEQRIRSRFEQGLLADIKPPDYELRMAILRNKINQNHIDVPTDVVDFLAQNLQENIRQLEGVIKKLAMSNLLTGQPVNMEMVIQTVPEYLRDAEPVSDTIDRIIECVSRRYNVSVEEIMGKSRKKETKTARNVAMYVVRSVTGSSLPQIGQVFDRDHSTVHSNISMIESELSSDPVLEATINEIMKEIKRN